MSSTPTLSAIATVDQSKESSKFDWQSAVREKQRELARKTPKEWMLRDDFIKSLNSGPTEKTNLLKLGVAERSGILSKREFEITEIYTAIQLLERLSTGEFSALEVTTAFCKRAVAAQQLLSCTTEVFYAEALKRACELDEYFRKEGKPVGPLHGLPISIKDSFCIKGIQSTVGYAKLLAEPPEDHDSPLVEMLQDNGAILYVKTNIPQTMMTADSENNIFGRTLNPHNTSVTAGGSSGGEGSLVAFRGSILGVGTDIAGSIRIPALCCGIYGFKPTADRVPFGKQAFGGELSGLPGLIPSAGPLATNMNDIELFLKTILSSRPEDYDATALAIPWREVSGPSRLRIGVLPEEKVFPLQPPVRRALRNAVQALEEAGHEIIHLTENPDCTVSFANRLAFAYYTLGPDDSKDYFGSSGEPMVASVAARYNPMFAGPLPTRFEEDTVHKIKSLHHARTAYDEAWRKHWVAHNIDVLLCPAAQNTAVPHDTYGWPPYTQIWNMLDYPACVIPFGKASKELDPHPTAEDNFGPQPSYSAELVDALPCSVQVVTRRMRDEECLFSAKIIDRVLRDHS